MRRNARARPRPWQPDWYVLRGLGRAIREAIAPLELSGSRVLDYGCGERPYEAWFRDRGADYAGADLHGVHEVAIGADGRLAAPDASFDLVASFQVLEHVWEVERYLAECHRVLAPGGRLLLSTHGVWLYHPHPEDWRRWTAAGLVREVEARGFRLERSWPVAGPLAWALMLPLVGVCHYLRRVPLAGDALAAALALPTNALVALADGLTPRLVTRDNACIYVALFARCA